MDQSLKIKPILGRRDPNGITIHDQHDQAEAPTRDRDQTRAIMNLIQNSKNAVTRNKLKLLAALNFIVIAGVGFSLIYPKWAKAYSQNGYDCWVNPIKISQYFDSSTVFHDFLLAYHKNGCNNNKNLCDAISPYIFSGLIATGVIAFGLLVQLINIIQILMFGFRKNCCLRQCFPPDIMQIGVLLIYVGAFVFWYFGTGFFTKPFVSFSGFLSVLGPSMFVYVASVLVYLVLLGYFQFLYKKTLQYAELNRLLLAENQLFDTMRDESMGSSWSGGRESAKKKPSFE